MRPTGPPIGRRIGPRRAAAALLLSALAVGSAAGCATAGSGSGSGSGSALPTPPPEPTSTLTLTGVVERGVEPGCLVLRAGGKSWTLLGGTGSTPATGVPLAVPVRVVGTVLTGVASYCQQGTLFKVVRVTRS